MFILLRLLLAERVVTDMCALELVGIVLALIPRGLSEGLLGDCLDFEALRLLSLDLPRGVGIALDPIVSSTSSMKQSISFGSI